MSELACLLAELIAGTRAPGAIGRGDNDRGAHNNKMAGLGVLLKSAQQHA